MKSVFKKLFLGALLLGVLFWVLTQPKNLRNDEPASVAADSVNGELVFHAGGCASCHGEGLEGGLAMETAFGTFRVPNITRDSEFGIGNWSQADFLNAMQSGISPEGRHYYPAFPFASYTRATVPDLLDLKAYIDSLPASSNAVADHDIGFPWNISRGIGLWNLSYLDQSPVIPAPPGNEAFLRGRYLVEALGHCAECHTPRNKLGGLDKSRWLAGAPNPDGEGRVPNITPHESGIAAWTERDIAYYLESGFTPDFDMVGSSMVEVQENMAHLTDEDRNAIASYLKLIPALPDKAD